MKLINSKDKLVAVGGSFYRFDVYDHLFTHEEDGKQFIAIVKGSHYISHMVDKYEKKLHVYSQKNIEVSDAYERFGHDTTIEALIFLFREVFLKKLIIAT